MTTRDKPKKRPVGRPRKKGAVLTASQRGARCRERYKRMGLKQCNVWVHPMYSNLLYRFAAELRKVHQKHFKALHTFERAPVQLPYSVVPGLPQDLDEVEAEFFQILQNMMQGDGVAPDPITDPNDTRPLDLDP